MKFYKCNVIIVADLFWLNLGYMIDYGCRRIQRFWFDRLRVTLTAAVLNSEKTIFLLINLKSKQDYQWRILRSFESMVHMFYRAEIFLRNCNKIFK